jgi:hypothetical protein
MVIASRLRGWLTEYMSNRHLPVMLAACVLLTLAACTSTTPRPTPSPSPRPTVGIAPQVQLGCSQGNAAGSALPSELLITDTVGTGFVGSQVMNLPLAGDVGIATPTSADWKFRKSPLFLAGASATVTISVPDDGRQFLLWVPTADWVGDATAAAQRPWITHQVVAAGCDQQGVDFLGGILTIDPERCFTLSVQSTDAPRLDLDVRADGGRCPA